MLRSYQITKLRRHSAPKNHQHFFPLSCVLAIAKFQAVVIFSNIRNESKESVFTSCQLKYNYFHIKTVLIQNMLMHLKFHSPVLFQSLYDSIKKEPFKIPEDDGNDLTHTFFNPDKEGWLLKQGMSYRLAEENLACCGKPTTRNARN